MSKHTPGPWDLLPLAHCQAIQAGPKNRICILDDHQEYDGEPCGSICSQDKAQEEIDANARLIAAAPELLKALRDLLTEFDSYDAEMAKIGRGHEDYGQQRAAARAAIAKAEGGVS